MFYQIFLSPQVKRCAIITYKHGIYDLSHELPNNLRLRILENYKILEKSQTPENDNPVPIPPAKVKILPMLVK